MMRLVGVGACAAVVAFCASSAGAADYYVSGALGGVFRNAYTTIIDQPTDPSGNRVFENGQFVPYQERAHTDYDPGVEASVAFGRRFSLGAPGALRAEAEFSYRDYQIGTTTVNSLPGQVYADVIAASFKTSVHEQRYAETANLFYDFTQFKGFTPYLGAGVGYQEGVSTAGTRVITTTAGAVTTAHVGSSHSDDGTWLAEAGVAVPLTPRLELAPAYRFSQAFDGQKAANVVRVALRYSF